jgi:trk system potassium uptake protein TrkA
MIVHNDDIIIPRGDSVIREGDKVIVFALSSAVSAVEKFFK